MAKHKENSAAKDSLMSWNRQPYGVNICAKGYTDYKQSIVEALAKVLYDKKNGAKDISMTSDDVASYREAAEKMIDDAISSQAKSASSGADMSTTSNVGTHILECQTVADSSIFGNDVINPYSGFCRDDDIVPTVFSHKGSTHSWGMGRVYKEIYDSKQSVMYIQFGIPKYKNLYHFLSTASNPGMSDLNDCGDSSLLSGVCNFFIEVTKLAIELPVLPFEWAHHVITSMMDDKVTEYFYFREQMFVYYNYVNTILIHLATGIGLFDGNSEVISNLDRSELPKILQNSDGEPKPDIYSILSTRSLRYGDKSVPHTIEKVGEDLAKRITADDDPDTLEIKSKSGKTTPSVYIKGVTYTEKNGEMIASGDTVDVFDDKGNVKQEIVEDAVASCKQFIYSGFWSNTWNDIKGVMCKIWNGYRASALDNTKWIAFRIEKDSDNASESFTNGLAESPLQHELNGYVQQNRANSLDASVAGGGFLSAVNRWSRKAGAFWNTISSALRSGGNSIASVVGYLHSGNGYYDLPQQWNNSSFSRSVNVNIRLRSRTGGDPVSVYTNVLIPFACILAGAMPRASGDSTYTSPFILRAYCRGMFSIPAGMITSLSITRGDSEFGWSIWRLPTTIALSLQITDLSPILFMGLQGSGSLKDTFWNAFKQAFDNNTKEHDYLDTVSGLGLKQRIYYMQNVKRNLIIAGRVVKSQYGNPTWWGLMIADTPFARTINAFRSAGSINVPNN